MDSTQQQNQQAEQRGTFKTELCNMYKRGGKCYYGSNCGYAHGVNELKTRKVSANYRTKECRNYSAYNDCEYGNRCQFKHMGHNECGEWVDLHDNQPNIIRDPAKKAEGNSKKDRKFKNSKKYRSNQDSDRSSSEVQNNIEINIQNNVQQYNYHQNSNYKHGFQHRFDINKNYNPRQISYQRHTKKNFTKEINDFGINCSLITNNLLNSTNHLSHNNKTSTSQNCYLQNNNFGKTAIEKTSNTKFKPYLVCANSPEKKENVTNVDQKDSKKENKKTKLENIFPHISLLKNHSSSLRSDDSSSFYNKDIKTSIIYSPLSSIQINKPIYK